MVYRQTPLADGGGNDRMGTPVLWVVVGVVAFLVLILLFRTTRGRRGRR
jgi:hypothetical protein